MVNLKKSVLMLLITSSLLQVTVPMTAHSEPISNKPAINYQLSKTPHTGPKYLASIGANLRLKPSAKSKKIAYVPKGTRVQVVSTLNGWTKVKVSGKSGYISNFYLAEDYNFSKDPDSVAQTTSRVNLRKKASLKSEVIKKLSKGQQIKVLSHSNPKWLKVRVGNTTGYISSRYVKTSNSQDSAVVTTKHTIGFKGKSQKKIYDMRPLLFTAWNGHNKLPTSVIQEYIDQGHIVTWGLPLDNYDGKTTQIIGHNPGVFSYMSNITYGSLVTISDINGKTRTYKIKEVLANVNNDQGLKFTNGLSLWDILDKGGKEEAVVIQMCQNNISHHYYGVPVK